MQQNHTKYTAEANCGAVFAPVAAIFRVIDDARAHRKITGAELSAAAGIHEVTYSRLRRKPEKATADVLQKLLAGLTALHVVSEAEGAALSQRIADVAKGGVA